MKATELKKIIYIAVEILHQQTYVLLSLTLTRKYANKKRLGLILNWFVSVSHPTLKIESKLAGA